MPARVGCPPRFGDDAQRSVGLSSRSDDEPEPATRSGGKPDRDGSESEAAYQLIRESVLSGAIAPGSTVSQSSLARETGFSRTSLRFALARLHGEGLIIWEYNRGMRVPALSAAEFEELTAAHVVLAAEALRIAVPRMTAEDVAQLEGRLAEMAFFAQQADYGRWRAADRRFVVLLASNAGQRFATIFTDLLDRTEPYRRMCHDGHPSGWITDTVHREILDACTKGDGLAAAQALARDIATVGFAVCAQLGPGFEPSRLRETLHRLGTQADWPPPVASCDSALPGKRSSR